MHACRCARLAFSLYASDVGGIEHSFGAQDGALPTFEDHTFCRTEDITVSSVFTLKHAATKLIPSLRLQTDKLYHPVKVVGFSLIAELLPRYTCLFRRSKLLCQTLIKHGLLAFTVALCL